MVSSRGRPQGSRSPPGWRCGAAVVGAGGAELAEGDRVAAGFGEEVAAVAEHVRPLPSRGSPSRPCAELPRGGIIRL